MLVTSKYSPLALRALDSFVQVGARVGGDIVVGYGAYEAGKNIAGETSGYLAAGFVGELRPWTRALDAVETAGKRSLALASGASATEVRRFLERSDELGIAKTLTRDDANQMLRTIAKSPTTDDFSLRATILGRTNGHLPTTDVFVVGTPPSDWDARQAYLKDPLNWHAERAIQQEMTRRQLSQGARELDEILGGDPSATLMRGNTGVGKTTALKKVAADDPAFMEFDPTKSTKEITERLEEGALNVDTAKARLVTHDRLPDERAITNMYQTHEEGKAVMNRVRDDIGAVASPSASGVRSYVVDARLDTVQAVQSEVNTALSSGRVVRVIDVDAPLELSAARVLGRTPGGDSPLVPWDAVAEGFANSRTDRLAVVSVMEGTSQVRGYKLFAMDASGNQVLVAQKIGGKVVVGPGQDVLFREVTATVTKFQTDVIGRRVVDDAFIRELTGKISQKQIVQVQTYRGLTLKDALDKHSKLLNP